MIGQITSISTKVSCRSVDSVDVIFFIVTSLCHDVAYIFDTLVIEPISVTVILAKL
ncbi:hypothetical protein ZOSMA_9G00200 [Zostera marina]|uniref:Uncharacterized protein n=1 Tax=Zostera marina TaxID=29655 RepID=A0A0K9NGM6_ZOSMR|nr:hypothetical protein ZOSMA_9G00200 [Zostera marina]